MTALPANADRGIFGSEDGIWPPVAPGKAVAGSVTLAEGVKAPSKAILFIIARQFGVDVGPPVAVKKIVNPTFPVEFVLRDEDIMNGKDLPLEMSLQARLDIDGDPFTRNPKDLIGIVIEKIEAGDQGVNIELTPLDIAF
eukprot:CAMPEP_0196655840 /NCGR_PEP_ID=MMETSP1086-20130531/9707_1 /TAXON_ID=77921 /ORGANISM="Cyanoptyche  gloeocystis , Strain SAG4.97" /LENGTH=139 /DNA_ID=CAMNT_0041988359 /DNA_START=241 /DNA_END=660 /DNA_ORIENTATION=-